jgi:hypothetical protein
MFQPGAIGRDSIVVGNLAGSVEVLQALVRGLACGPAGSALDCSAPAVILREPPTAPPASIPRVIMASTPAVAADLASSTAPTCRTRPLLMPTAKTGRVIPSLTAEWGT